MPATIASSAVVLSPSDLRRSAGWLRSLAALAAGASLAGFSVASRNSATALDVAALLDAFAADGGAFFRRPPVADAGAEREQALRDAAELRTAFEGRYPEQGPETFAAVMRAVAVLESVGGLPAAQSDRRQPR